MAAPEHPSEGINPSTAGTMLGLIAALGIGLYALSVMMDYKSPDPFYDRDNLESHTSSKLMETPDLWKKKSRRRLRSGIRPERHRRMPQRPDDGAAGVGPGARNPRRLRWVAMSLKAIRLRPNAPADTVLPLTEPALQFELLATDPSTHARQGRMTTRHGSFDTPAFMPVGTQGTIKGLTPDHVAATGSQCILANTYHLMLRPGEKVVAELGDLHRFMAWPGPILTDSGGFQVFSLADLNKITDAGVTFKSHIDGSMVHLDPARSMAVQNALGADIIMAFDECPAADAPAEYQAVAVERTLRWAEQCIAAHRRPNDQSLFGIVQGGTDPALRERCAKGLIAMDFPGYAIGGLAVGEGFDAMKGVLVEATPILPANKPRYLMGVGFPRDIAVAVAAGIDMFDCVLPTRNGRNAYAFTGQGPIRLRNSRFTSETGPIEAGCDCYACRHFSCGAIRHYFFAGEMLGPVLVSAHNMRFYQRFMADLRQSIGGGTFARFLAEDPRCRQGPSEM